MFLTKDFGSVLILTLYKAKDTKFGTRW